MWHDFAMSNQEADLAKRNHLRKKIHTQKNMQKVLINSIEKKTAQTPPPYPASLFLQINFYIQSTLCRQFYPYVKNVI